MYVGWTKDRCRIKEKQRSPMDLLKDFIWLIRSKRPLKMYIWAGLRTSRLNRPNKSFFTYVPFKEEKKCLRVFLPSFFLLIFCILIGQFIDFRLPTAIWQTVLFIKIQFYSFRTMLSIVYFHCKQFSNVPSILRPLRSTRLQHLTKMT